MPADTIELVVTDLDGTLWDTPDYTPEVTQSAVAQLADRGIPLLVATGRRRESTRRPLAELGLRPPAVMLNGGLGVDLKTGEAFHRGGFSRDEATAVLRVFADLSLEPCIYVDAPEPSVRVGPRPSTHVDHLASFGADAGIDALEAVVANETVLSFSVLGLGRSVAAQLEAALVSHAVPHNAPDRQYGGYSITVAPRDVSKREGIESFCSWRNLDPARVLVLGDGPNDVEMLDMAAVALVPADGHRDALACADRIIAPASDGGWAEVLDFV